MPLPSAMKSMRQRLGRQGGLTYEVEVVAQYAANLPLPPGTKAQFVLKRRHRLCVTEAETVDESGAVEWNTRCSQTATLFKDGDSWRPKEFGFKVQAVKDAWRPGQEQAQTVAKASLDLSQFCTAEPFGPKQLSIQLQPAGVLAVSIRTQWLQHFDRETDTLTDISYLSLAHSVTTSAAGSWQLGTAAGDEQDLSGFDAGAGAGAGGAGAAGGGGAQFAFAAAHSSKLLEAAAASGAGAGAAGGIRAAYPAAAAAAPTSSADSGAGGAWAVGAAGAACLPNGASPALKKRTSVAAVLRLPRRGTSAKEQLQQQQQQPASSTGSLDAAGATAAPAFEFTRPHTAVPASSSGIGGAGAGSGTAAALGSGPLLHRSATAPSCMSLSTASGGDAPGSGSLSSRRPPGASLLLIPDPPAMAGGLGGGAQEASTPTLLLRQQRPPLQQQGTAGQKQAQQAAALAHRRQHSSVAVGLPPECWSPINLQEAVDKLYDSEEEPTPKPSSSVFGTVRRFFGRARNESTTPPGSATAKQLHATFNTPRPTPPRVTPNPGELATIDRESSMSALRRRCKQLLAERDEARAEGYAEAALAVEQSLEIDKLVRSKDMLLQRLHTIEQQLLATYRDEASTDLIQALAAARVEVAQRDYQLMELQHQLRVKDTAIDKLRAQLTRLETKYRSSINALSPRSNTAPLSPWGSATSPAALAAAAASAAETPGARPLQHSPFVSPPQVQHMYQHLDSTGSSPMLVRDNPLAAASPEAAVAAGGGGTATKSSGSGSHRSGGASRSWQHSRSCSEGSDVREQQQQQQQGRQQQQKQAACRVQLAV